MVEKIYTLPEKFSELVKQFPDKTVMQMKTSEGYSKFTYKDIYRISQSVAFSLYKSGLKKGDRIAIVLENRPEWSAIYFAIMFAGCIAVPLDPQSTKEDIKYFLSNSKSKVVFTSQQFLSLFPKLSLLKIITLDNKIFAAESPTTIAIEVSPKGIASILYTSGTTGKPKGVMLTHENFYANFQSINKLKIFTEKGHHNILSILPLHHSFPFMVTLIVPLFTGNLITYVESLRVEEILASMRETKVTILVGVPQIFYMFCRHISDEINKFPFLFKIPLSASIELLWLLRKLSKINLSKVLLAKIHQAFGAKLKFFVSGGARLDPEVAEFLTKIGFTILEGYGLTETAPVVTFNRYGKQKIGSVGQPIPEVKVKIINPNKHGIGEVAISGRNVMLGYYKLKEETQQVLKNDWFYSGDLGYLDKQNYLYLTGRKKELIILSGGKNITPEEIESYYSQSPFVKELCVLAIGEGTKERLAAVIVPDVDYCRKVGQVNIRGSIKWDIENLSKKFPAYKRIMDFIVVKEDLPRTRLGKLKRFAIKDKYLRELTGIKAKEIEEEVILSDEDLRILSSEIGKQVIKTLTNRAKITREIKLDDNLEMDLAFDSLERIELAATLEKLFKVKIPSSVMLQTFSVRELILNIEKLQKKHKKKLVAELETFSWSDILRTNPSNEVIAKIAIHPKWYNMIATAFISGISRLLLKLLWCLKTIDAEKLPLDKPFIYCANHNSYMDGFLIAAAAPNWLRSKLFFLGIRGIFELPVIRSAVKAIRVIPIDPGAHLIDAMQAAAYVFRHGKMVCIFPEGARSIDGEVKEFKKGIGILAKELNVDLVPIYIAGSYEAWPRGQRIPRPHPITVIFGRPYNIAELKRAGSKLGAKDTYEAITLAIREKVIDLKSRLT
jgi:long-chain acyl-CoA synthetase